MLITFYGHSCFLVSFEGTNLLFDPFISGNELATGVVDVNTIPADYIMLTHGHADHVADVEVIAKRTNAPIISGYEVVSWFGAKGLNGHPLNHGGKVSFNFGTVKYVNAVHSSTMPDGSAGGHPGGFVIWNADRSACFYVAGDTALTTDMKLIPLTCPELQVAILPIGDNFTMGYEDAAIAADYINCHEIIGCHYDTFGYIKIDRQAAKAAFTQKGHTLHLPDIGASLSF